MLNNPKPSYACWVSLGALRGTSLEGDLLGGCPWREKKDYWYTRGFCEIPGRTSRDGFATSPRRSPRPIMPLNDSEKPVDSFIWARAEDKTRHWTRQSHWEACRCAALALLGLSSVGGCRHLPEVALCHRVCP
jgi:hypothetical protein